MQVATVLTVYGIETEYTKVENGKKVTVSCNSTYRLRYWNFHNMQLVRTWLHWCVATVLTVYGIETLVVESEWDDNLMLQQYLPFTVLKLDNIHLVMVWSLLQLQQYLPFTVLKLAINFLMIEFLSSLQQYLPFTVLKL